MLSQKVEPQSISFEIGPDQAGDIRQQRPYFAVQLEIDNNPMPFVQAAFAQPHSDRSEPYGQKLFGRITSFLQATDGEEKKVTDIYLLSHGWHRNYYEATSAYDRLVSRFTRLLRRGVLDTPDEYRPLILGAHWHSDPNEDQWVDPAGRRNKQSFLDNIESVFERPKTADEVETRANLRFTSVFEACFAYISRLCAVDTCALSDDELTSAGALLAGRLDSFQLRDVVDARIEDKIAAVWTCYHESVAKQPVTDQQMPPARGLTARQAAKNFAQFIVGSIGLLTVLAYLFGQIPISIGIGLSELMMHVLGFHRSNSLTTTAVFIAEILLLALGFVVLGAVGQAVLISMGRSSRQKLMRGVPFWIVAAWFPFEVVRLAPTLLYILWTYFFSDRDYVSRPGVFAERIGERDAANLTNDDANGIIEAINTPETIGKYTSHRRKAAWRSMEPLWLFERTIASTNPSKNVFAGLENTLSFYEMQLRGTVAGRTAAQFLYELVENQLKPRGLCAEDVRIHLVGHSFGGLVVLNCARHLALDETCRGPQSPPMHVQSVTLLQAAVSSNWIENEGSTISNIVGKVVCSYSAYDTANSFYYPVASSGRLAAGYVGLCGLPGSTDIEPLAAFRIPRLSNQTNPQFTVDQVFKEFDTVDDDKGLFALLVRPPDLRSRVMDLGDPKVLNIDSSRICYQGPFLLGGGHMDIYKDDIINMIWAITRL